MGIIRNRKYRTKLEEYFRDVRENLLGDREKFIDRINKSLNTGQCEIGSFKRLTDRGKITSEIVKHIYRFSCMNLDLV